MRLAVLLVAVMASLVAATLPPEGVFFLKFHKVAGTVVAEMIGGLAQRDNRSLCCSNAGCDVCLTHASLERYTTSHRLTPSGALGVVVLRHPVEREISRYYFDRATGNKVALGTTIEHWASQVPRNEYCSVLGRGRVDLAEHALVHDFALVGITERMSEFLSALGVVFNETPAAVAQRPLKRMLDRPAAEELSAATLARLNKRLAPDIELYDRAQRISAQKIASVVRRYGDDTQFRSYVGEVERLIAEQPKCTGEHHSSPGLVGVDCYRVPKPK